MVRMARDPAQRGVDRYWRGQPHEVGLSGIINLIHRRADTVDQLHELVEPKRASRPQQGEDDGGAKDQPLHPCGSGGGRMVGSAAIATLKVVR